MKKTLITLAAVAMASVVQAATLDLTNYTANGSLTLGTGMTLNEDGSYTVKFAGDSSDSIILGSGVTKVNGSVLTYGDVIVHIKDSDGNDAILFGQHYNAGTGVLNGATIDFGLNGKLEVNQTSNINMYNQALTFKATIDFAEFTDNPSKINDIVTLSRELLVSTSSDVKLWNATYGEGFNHTFTVNAVQEGLTPADKGAIGTDTSMGETYGDFSYCASSDGSTIVVRYNAKLVPEPATATLGLLALAGLAARRRRK